MLLCHNFKQDRFWRCWKLMISSTVLRLFSLRSNSCKLFRLKMECGIVPGRSWSAPGFSDWPSFPDCSIQPACSSLSRDNFYSEGRRSVITCGIRDELLFQSRVLRFSDPESPPAAWCLPAQAAHSPTGKAPWDSSGEIPSADFPHFSKFQAEDF